MKQHEEESRSDRVIEVETDDEEYEAERHCEDNGDDDTESDDNNDFGEGTSRINSSGNPTDSNLITWPQSYRQSIDMYTSVTPPVSFLRSSSVTSVISRRSSQIIGNEQSLSRPLISEEEVPTSTLPVRLSLTSGSRSSSIFDLPPPKLCSYSQALLNAINGLCGIGILSTPYALKEGGWLSLFLLLILGVISCYTGILLKRCLESSPELETYPDIGQAAFGMVGRICIAVVLYMELYSSCIEYLIMMSDNMASMFPNARVEFAGIHLDSYQLCAIISTLVILPTVWLRNLSLLSYVSVGGVLMLVMVVLCMLWVGVTEIGFHTGGTAFNFAKLPVTLGIYSFCYGGHSVFPNIYASMEEPSRFPSILLISFSTVCALYVAVSICGFMMFGDLAESQFTLNLPPKFAASKVAAWTVVITPVTKYALTLTPIAYGLEELLPLAWMGSYSMSILIRTVLVGSTLAIALTVPFFGSLMALIGSLLVMLVSLIFPCACYIKLGRNLTKSQIGTCITIILIGVTCAIIGTYSSISNVADEMAKS